MYEMLCRIDDAVIRTMRRVRMPLSRFALFAVYFWFGILKVLDMSPASPMVTALQGKTLPFFNAELFLVAFGVIEMIIGIAFLVPRLERFAIGLMVMHMGTTILPLVLVPEAVWVGFLVPTLEGQYVVKNIAFVAVAVGIASQLVPLESDRR